jgi:hypothetical protein
MSDQRTEATKAGLLRSARRCGGEEKRPRDDRRCARLGEAKHRDDSDPGVQADRGKRDRASGGVLAATTAAHALSLLQRDCICDRAVLGGAS